MNGRRLSPIRWGPARLRPHLFIELREFRSGWRRGPRKTCVALKPYIFSTNSGRFQTREFPQFTDPAPYFLRSVAGFRDGAGENLVPPDERDFYIERYPGIGNFHVRRRH